MRKILYVDACVNRETSRTEVMAQALLARLTAEADARVEMLVLEDAPIEPLDAAALAKRNALIEARDYSDPMFDWAHQFREADIVVIAAPYWDLSFPSVVKTWVEQLCVNGLTFSYSDEGIPVGHCNAQCVYYVTSVGGYTFDYNMGFDYIAAVCKLYFGIERACCFKAEGLDIVGADVEGIMRSAIAMMSVSS